MKRTPQDKQIEARLCEGEWTLTGCLGDDPLGTDRIEIDRAKVMGLGVDLSALADELDSLWQAGGARCNAPSVLACGLTVTVEEARGKIACPFDHPGTYAKGVMTVVLPDRQLRFSPLSIHMMRAHGFLGGKGSAYRVEPEDLAALSEALQSEQQQQ